MGKKVEPPVEKTNFELATHFLEDIWTHGNEETIFKEFEGVATGLWPDEEGIDPHGFLQYYRALKPLIDGLTFEYKTWNEDGPHLWISWVVHGRHWKKSDKAVRWPGAATARYREGKMVECNNHHDFLVLFSQLELVPEQAFEYYGLGGPELIEAENRRREELPPSARNQSHFMWPGLRKVKSSGRELYLPCSARQLSTADIGREFSLPDEGQLEVLFESTAFAMVIVDQHDAIQQADESFSELVDRLPESLPGVVFHQFVLPEDQGRERALFAELVQGERVHYRHRVRLMRGRTVVWTQLAVARIPTSDGGHKIVRAIQESSRVEELVEFQETERKRLSVELHDGLAQEIATLWIYLQTARHQRMTPELMERCLLIVERMGQELRSRMKDLRSPLLEGSLLSEALEAIVSQNIREKGVDIVLDLDADVDQVDHTVSLLVYRVVQEALRNVANHSNAKNCWVTLKRGQNKLLGSVRDDGRGFDLETAAAKGRLGIRGMKDRCELVGGSLEISSGPGIGTMIHLELPWTPGASDT